MSKKLTEAELNNIINNSSILSSKPVNLTDIVNSCYFLIANTFSWLLTNNKTKQQYVTNKQYIENIAHSNNVDYITTILADRSNKKTNIFDRYKQVINQHPLLSEVNTKTEKIENSDYGSFISYIAGNCWINAKLSNDIVLTPDDIGMISSINKLVDSVEPLSHPVKLFHGFEQYTNYNIPVPPKIGSIVGTKGFLSKSLSLNVAKSFAVGENLFRPKFIMVEYPIGSKHIHPNFRITNEEFEYLTNSGEKLEITDIKSYFDFPQFLTFYCCRPLVQPDTTTK